MKFLKRIFVFTLLVAMIAGCSSNSASDKSKKKRNNGHAGLVPKCIALFMQQLKKVTLKKKE